MVVVEEFLTHRLSNHDGQSVVSSPFRMLVRLVVDRRVFDETRSEVGCVSRFSSLLRVHEAMEMDWSYNVAHVSISYLLKAISMSTNRHFWGKWETNTVPSVKAPEYRAKVNGTSSKRI